MRDILLLSNLKINISSAGCLSEPAFYAFSRSVVQVPDMDRRPVFSTVFRVEHGKAETPNIEQ